MTVTVEYEYGFSEQVDLADARAKIEESAVEDVRSYPLRWEADEWGENATQAHPYFAGKRRFVGRIYLPSAAAEEAANNAD